MIPAQLIYDPATDTLRVTVAAAEGVGDVTLLALDCRALAAEDKQRLSHVRDPDQAQRPPGTSDVRAPST